MNLIFFFWYKMYINTFTFFLSWSRWETPDKITRHRYTPQCYLPDSWSQICWQNVLGRCGDLWRDTPESLLDRLCSIVATFKFRAAIDCWKGGGVDFSTYLYVPEMDPVTGQERHDCGDHKHLFRRAASSIRQGKDPSLNLKAFNDVLMDSLRFLKYLLEMVFILGIFSSAVYSCSFNSSFFLN